MKAVVYTSYGPPEVLQIRERKKPRPSKGKVLVKIVATTVTAGDWRMRKASPFMVRFFNGLFRPRRVTVLGLEVAGIIEEIGEGVSQFKVGDEVMAATGFSMGGYAEYKCLSENHAIVPKPDNSSFEEAAAIPIGAGTALYFLRDKGKLESGQKVLIYGASGSVGTYAIQVATYYGAIVTAVCSTQNTELVKSLGAESVIDYTKESLDRAGTNYDLVFDAVGKISKGDCRDILTPGGKFLTVNKGLARDLKKNLAFLRDLVEEGKLKVVIDQVYPMDQIVVAHRYVEQGHKKGNVVITIADHKEWTQAQ